MEFKVGIISVRPDLYYYSHVSFSPHQRKRVVKDIRKEDKKLRNGLKTIRNGKFIYAV